MRLYATSFSEEEARAAKAMGCGVEIAFTAARALDGFSEEARARAEECLSGASGASVHGACFDMNYATTDPLIREVVKKRFSQSLHVAAALGAPVVVLHSCGNRYEGKDAPSMARWLSRCAAFWEEFLPTAPPGVRVVLENMDDDSPEMFLRQLDIVAPYGALCCFDAGHAACNSRVPAEEWVDALGGRIAHVHLHDNDLSRDRHWALGTGRMPVEEILRRLNRVVAPGTPCVLECDFTRSLRWLQRVGARFDAD